MVKLGSKLNFVFFFYSSLGSRPSARRPPLLSVAPTRHCAAGQRRGASRPPGHMAAPAPRSPITLPQSHRSFLLLLRRDVQECAGGHHCRPSGKLVPRLPQTSTTQETLPFKTASPSRTSFTSSPRLSLLHDAGTPCARARGRRGRQCRSAAT